MPLVSTNAAPLVPTPGSAPDERAWRGILSRDPALDAAFVFAVTTTGIYCRPSCAARRPRRAHVVLHPLPATAEAHGFRACLRCKPQSGPATPDLALATEVCRALQAEPAHPSLADIAAAHTIDVSTLRRRFTKVVGVSPTEYRNELRIHAVRKGLRAGAPVRAATYRAGFRSVSRAYTTVRQGLGMSPATYGAGGLRATVAFVVRPCTLGKVLIAATDAGLCSVRVGDTRHALEAELRNEFHAATIHPGASRMDALVDEVVRRVEGQPPGAELPVDIRTTAFQRKLYAALVNIPVGETRTYGELAASIGAPGSARAVGTACASNPLAVVVPCHRVVRADGALGGYRWGVDRKRRLLERERHGPPSAGGA